MDSIQTLWKSLLGGSSGESPQSMVNTYVGNPVTKKSIQEVMTENKGITPGSKSVQEMLFENLTTDASLTGPFSRYSVQEMLQKASDLAISVATVIGFTSGSSFDFEEGSSFDTEDGNNFIFQA